MGWRLRCSLIALTLVMLTTLGVGLSVAMPNTVMAIVILLVLWYSMTFFFPLVGLDVLSPGSLLGNLPDIIKGAWSLGDWETVAGFIAVSGASTAALVSLLLHEGHLKGPPDIWPTEEFPLETSLIVTRASVL